MTHQTARQLTWAILFLVGLGVLFVMLTKPTTTPEIPEPALDTVPAPVTPTSTHAIIGSSVEGRSIEAYTLGTGATDLLFVGGVHGGYEWNSILLAYEMIDYLQSSPDTIPENVTVHIIPNLNPDGLFAATGLVGEFTAVDIPNTSGLPAGTGRFNANQVDLNRNFACKWAPESTWRNNPVSAGTAAFSEPEAVALRDYVQEFSPQAVVFWHSVANNVYASECENGVLPETLSLMRTYASASGYGAVPVFDAYPITGDAEGWLASIGIPAVTVELGSRNSIEWSQNLAGTNAVLQLYSEPL